MKMKKQMGAADQSTCEPVNSDSTAYLSNFKASVLEGRARREREALMSPKHWLQQIHFWEAATSKETSEILLREAMEFYAADTDLYAFGFPRDAAELDAITAAHEAAHVIVAQYFGFDSQLAIIIDEWPTNYLGWY